jgi:hypothetical protein
MMKANDLLQRFESGEIDPATFDHRAHIVTAFGLLQQAPYLDAVVRYVKGIKQLAVAAGVPHKFNLTITIAFLSLIAERLEDTPSASAEDFLERNPDLLAPDFLFRWYEPQRLSSAAAKRLFLMPQLHNSNGCLSTRSRLDGSLAIAR